MGSIPDNLAKMQPSVAMSYPASHILTAEFGVPRERVHPATLRLFERLFPGNHGIDFLAKLLRLATAKQLALPGLETADVAEITIQSLRVLAKRLGFSYDMTEKYIVVLCQLHLLMKQRHRQHITLHFPLGYPELAEPFALDALDDYRPKVRTFAKAIKRRFVLLRARGEIETCVNSEQPPGLLSSLTTPLLDDIARIVDEEVDSEVGKRLLLKITGALHYRCSQEAGRLFVPKGDSEQQDTMSVSSAYTKKSPFQSEKGDFEITASQQQSLLSARKGDSDIHRSSQKSSSHTPKGDFSGSLLPQKRRLSEENGNSDAQKGDFQEAVSIEETANVTVILRNKIDTLNDNVGTVAIYLCSLFSENPKTKAGYYKNLYNTQKCRSVEAWLAAIIETAQAEVRREPGKKGNPGGYFYKRCIALHRDGISPRTMQLVRQYSGLTYQQLLEVLQHGNHPQPQEAPPPRPYTASPRQKLTLAIPRLPKSEPGMTRQEYEQLKRQVNGPGREYMRSQPYQQDDGSIIVLVEDFLGDQHWICSLDEWLRSIPMLTNSRWPDSQSKQKEERH